MIYNIYMYTISIECGLIKAINNSEHFIPKNKKFFNGDIINDSENIISSNIRNSLLTGIVKPNKATYTNKDKNKGTYLLIPLIKNLPNFQIELKKIKDKKDRYVIFSFLSWDNVMPLGVLHENLGPIENYDQFIDKILIINNNLIHYNRKDLVQKDINLDWKKQIHNINYSDFTKYNTFSIDPPNTEDIDDAFTFYFNEDTKNKILIISITDVTAFL